MTESPLPTVMLDAAGRQARWLGRSGAVCLVAGIGLAAASWSAPAVPARIAFLAAAALLLAAGPLLALALVSAARRSLRAGRPTAIAGASQVAVVAVASLSAIAGSVLAWPMPGAPGGVAAGLACAAVAFALLVLERHAATTPAAELPEAPALAATLRAALAAFLLIAVSVLLTASGMAWPALLLRLGAVIVIATAAELVLRAAATLFLPAPARERPRLIARSLVAQTLLAAPSLRGIGDEVHRQFGIDLGRSWALGFLRRAAIPALGCLALAGWLSTGLTALPIDQRGVYERLGIPAGVFGPGLHAHLPWPFGTVRRVELGIVHETPVGLATGAPVALIPAEAAPPASADRLWDQSHPAEASYLVASAARGVQEFQVVDVDLRLVWRVGASDQAVLDAAYRTAAPETLLRAAAGRLLVRGFATETLPGLLGEDRDRLTRTFRTALQADLDGLGAGIEIVAVAVEAIHPPPAAAPAYQNVQAAGVRSRVAVAEQTGQAAGTVELARQTAIVDRNIARMEAADSVAQARIQGARFGADQAGYAREPDVFLLERRFDRLAQGLSRARLVVVDHRLSGDTLPTLDMRPASLVPSP